MINLNSLTTLTFVYSKWTINFNRNLSSNQIYDLIIIGGGIVGAATARLLSIKHPQFNYALVEKENSLGNLIIIKVV